MIFFMRVLVWLSIWSFTSSAKTSLASSVFVQIKTIVGLDVELRRVMLGEVIKIQKVKNFPHLAKEKGEEGFKGRIPHFLNGIFSCIEQLLNSPPLVTLSVRQTVSQSPLLSGPTSVNELTLMTLITLMTLMTIMTLPPPL